MMMLKPRGTHLESRAAFREGSLAFFNGQDIAVNPYAPLKSDDAEAWVAGWTHAHRLRQRVSPENPDRGTTGNLYTRSLRTLEAWTGQKVFIDHHDSNTARDFCFECLRTTVDKSAGSTYTINGIGTKLYGQQTRCNCCGSVVAVKWVTFFFIPVCSLGRYRVLYQPHGGYLSRWIPPFTEE
jgi:hypothetical protein